MTSNAIHLQETDPRSARTNPFIVSAFALAAACVLLAAVVASASAAYRRLAGKDSLSEPVLLSEQSKYQVFSGEYNDHEIPWIFDGEQRKYGEILALWPADMKANRAACRSEWAGQSGYPALCGDLMDQQILAVQLDDIQPPLVVYVPVSRIAAAEIGEKVMIRMGRIGGDGRVHTLPAFAGYQYRHDLGLNRRLQPHGRELFEMD
ncbi:hypothetical protein [Noviherbaspirillum sp. UKPF54]|uniref:hypothetical protein n=1 Tax=Noviherbaspirillum sp. UKPF54 TaxID=2601898 RepID=UPI0011B11211|nr:hypothetical protein [Noviherbaspirillum sp. UKPF54]QDZ29672.1 hypothetical protein FAY22_17920 [Noviherbaspirillum sp. UKPF54]